LFGSGFERVLLEAFGVWVTRVWLCVWIGESHALDLGPGSEWVVWLACCVACRLAVFDERGQGFRGGLEP